MYKKLLFTLSMSYVVISNAQISITDTDMPAIGDVIINATDTFPTVNPGSSGPNQTWVFTSVNAHFYDSIEFLLPASTPFASDFPTANVAFVQGPGFVYANLNTNDLSLLGIKGDLLGDGIQRKYTITPKNVLAQFSMDYSDTYSTNHTEFITLGAAEVGAPAPIDSVKLESVVSKAVTIDSWGSVTTPEGTFNALRQKNVTVTNSKIYAKAFGFWSVLQDLGDAEQTTYQWWSNDPGTGFPVIEMVEDSGNITSVTYMTTNVTVKTQNLLTEKIDFQVYPNPSADVVFFNSESELKTIKFFDLSGKIVKQESNIQTVNVQNLPSGSYIIKVEDAKGNTGYLNFEKL